MLNTVIYQSHIYSIGGVETFLYELAKLSFINKRDLTVIYRTGDSTQIQRLGKYCRVLALRDVEKPIKCKTAIFNYNIDAINDFEADKYLQLIHADFKIDPNTRGLKLIQSDKITRYFGVSKAVVSSFKELSGKDAAVLYNPISIEDEPKIMTLLSAHRMIEAKGSKRIELMVKALDEAKIPYVWHIFTDKRLDIASENIMYHKPTLDIRRWVKSVDYNVLLSDSEGFSYGLYESLCLGTPVITTPLRILDEVGINDSNSIIVNFDLSNLDVREIYNKAGTFKFEYKQKSTKPWLDLLPEESTFIPPKYVKIECLRRYFDVVLNTSIKVGETYEVTEERAKIIVSAGYAKTV